MSNYELFIALRHLRSRRDSFLSTITIIAMVGVVVGVTALTSVVAVTGGFEEAFRERVLGVNSHILVVKYGIDFRDYRDVQRSIEEVPGVEATSPFIFHEMIATRDGETAGVLVKGIEPETQQEVSDLPRYLHQPEALAALSFERFPEDGQKGVPRALLGGALAEKIGVEVGQTIRLTSPLESLDPDRWSSDEHAPTTDQFVVAGTFSSGFHKYDSRLLIVDYRALQDFFNQSDVVTGVDVRVKDVFGVDAIAAQINAAIDAKRFNIITWKRQNRNLFTSLEVQRLVLFVLFCFIVLVASFNIVATLIMIVLDKRKDIAILKSMGATSRGVMMVFMAQGMIIGAIGTVAGLLGGLGVCLAVRHSDFGLDPDIYMIDHLPVKISAAEFGVVGGVAMLITLVATLGPSWWAARFNPVEGLRYD